MKCSTFLEPLAALLMGWMTELGPSRIASAAFLESRFRMPSRPFLAVPATVSIPGTFGCMVQDAARSGPFPADSLSGQAWTALMASGRVHALAAVFDNL